MSAYTCYHCGKVIRGQVVHYVPPIYLIRLGLDFARAYHPACHARAEKEAEKELNAK